MESLKKLPKVVKISEKLLICQECADKLDNDKKVILILHSVSIWYGMVCEHLKNMSYNQFMDYMYSYFRPSF